MKKKKAARLKAKLRDLQHQNDQLLKDIRLLVGANGEAPNTQVKDNYIMRFRLLDRCDKAMWSGSPASISFKNDDPAEGLLSLINNNRPYNMQGESIPEGVTSIKVPLSSQHIQSQCGETPRNLFGKSTTTEPGERNTNY